MASSASQAEIRVQRKITAAIATSAALDSVLTEVARAAARLCGAPMAMITLLTPSREELEVVGVHGPHAPLLGARLGVAASLNGLVIRTARSVRSTDVLRDPRPVARHLTQFSDARSLLVVPLRTSDGPFGTLAVGKRIAWRFSDRDEKLLTQLADSASIAIQHAQLRAQLNRVTAPISPLGEATTGAARAQSAKPAGLAVGSTSHGPHHLSPREHEILQLIAGGKTCREAASTLRISSRTVQHYLERLKQRFRQPRLPALAAYFTKHNGESV